MASRELVVQMPKMMAIAAVVALSWNGDREVRLFVLGGLIGWLSQEERRTRDTSDETLPDALPPRLMRSPPERFPPEQASRPSTPQIQGLSTRIEHHE